MTVFLAGNELEILTYVSGAAAVASTDANVAIANVNRAGFSIANGGVSSVQLPSNRTEGWMHCQFHRDGAFGGTTTNAIALRNAEGQNIFRIVCEPSAVATTSYALLTASPVSIGLQTFAVDVYWKISATVGILRVYVNGSLVGEVTGNVQFPSGTQSVNNIYLQGPQGNATTTCHYSNIVVADTPTLGARVHTLPLTVAATNNWTGTPAGVTGTSVGTAISETTANDEISFNAADFATTLQSGYAIDAVIISSRAQALTGSPVTRLQGRSRISGTPYDVGGSVLLGTGFAPVQHVIAQNPATATSWTVSGVNGAEFGVQAKA